LAAEGSSLPHEDNMDLTAPTKFIHTGAKLSALTEADLYKGILAKRIVSERQTTVAKLDITRWAVKDLSGKLPTDDKIWQLIRHKDITRSIRGFMWKGLHGAHRCGKFWENTPGHKHRAICPTCKVEESMEYILLECSAPGQLTVWNLSKTLWQQKYDDWPTITIGTILGCGMSIFIDKGANCLFHIIISESAHLIWKLQCERCIVTPLTW
jgi:hypothetical protein